MSEERAELAPEQVVDRFVIERKVGDGGMATVYEVRHLVLGTRHALKVLKLTHPELVSRFEQEGRIAAHLDHPNLVPVTDTVRVEDRLGLVMELVEGPTLEARLGDGPLDPDELDHVARGILAGVACAHREGIVHRDLKPGNILLQRDGGSVRPRVMDFGIAKALEPALRGQRGVTRAGIVMGSPGYMAPEQHHALSHTDSRSDVFALGAVFYEAATGRALLRGPAMADLLRQAEDRDYPPISEAAPHLPGRVAAAIGAALEPEPGDRPADAGALLELWSGAVSEPAPGPPAGSTIWVRSPDGSPPERRQEMGGWRWFIVALAIVAGSAALLVAVAMIVVPLSLLLAHREPSPPGRIDVAPDPTPTVPIEAPPVVDVPAGPPPVRPTPRVAAPPPKPAPAPPRLMVGGVERYRVVSGAGEVVHEPFEPGQVDLQVDWGDGVWRRGVALSLEPGSATHVHCDFSMELCSVR